jgi:hypothetical protein
VGELHRLARQIWREVFDPPIERRLTPRLRTGPGSRFARLRYGCRRESGSLPPRLRQVHTASPAPVPRAAASGARRKNRRTAARLCK